MPHRDHPASERFSTVLHELRSAARRLLRARGYTVHICVNLVLGMAAAATMFVVVNDVVLKPLPYPDSDRLVVIEHELPGIPMQGQPTRFGGFQGLAPLYGERSSRIEEIGVFGAFDAAISDSAEPEYVRIGYASSGFFAALGVRAAAGMLPEGAAAPGPGEQLTVLSHELWRTRYGADPSVVGSFLTVEGTRRQITGVMPAGELFPRQPVAAWNARPAATIESYPQVLVDGLVARMSPEATTESVRRELDSLIVELPTRTRDEFVARAVREGRLRSRVTSMRDHLLGDIGRGLWLLLGGALLVFVAALFNVTNLTLVRAQVESRQFAVRAALGASLRQLRGHRLAEATLLGLASGSASCGLTLVGIAALLRWAPLALPRLDEIAAGSEAVTMVGFLTLLSSAWVTIVASLGPGQRAALRSTRVGAAGRRSRLVRDGLAAAQLAVALVLLVSAGLLLRSFVALSSVDPGFDPTNVVTFRVPFPFQEIEQAGAAGGVATPFYDALSERIRGVPGVVAAGYGACAPLSDSCHIEGLTLDRADVAVDPADAGSLAGILQIAPGYLEALGIPLLRGRRFEVLDHEQRTNAMLVGAGLADRLWPGDDPIGKTVVTRDLPDWAPFTVVGVVADARHSGLRNDPEPIAYLPVFLRDQGYELRAVSFVVRADGDPLDLVSTFREVVRELRPDIPLARVETMAGRLERATSGMRLGTLLLAFSAGATLLLGALGVYGVIAYAVVLRRREFGVRMAVGATAGNLRALVIRHATVVTTAGSVAGITAALVVGRLLEALLYHVPATDPTTYGGVVLLLALVCLLAATTPASRAARTDPVEVLRAD